MFLSPLQPLQREGELDALAASLSGPAAPAGRTRFCLRRHQLIVGFAVTERLGDRIHVPFDGAERAGQHDEAGRRKPQQFDWINCQVTNAGGVIAMSAKGLHANVRSAAAISIEVTESRERSLERQPRATFPLAIANIALDARSPLPIHEQICQAVRTAIWARRIAAGTLMPTTRELAHHLGVARNTVVFAYARSGGGGSLRVEHAARNARGGGFAGPISLYRAAHAAAPREAVSTRLRTAFQLRDALETRIERTIGRTLSLYSFDPVQYPRTKLGRRLADKFLGAPLTHQFGLRPDSFNRPSRTIYGRRAAWCAIPHK